MIDDAKIYNRVLNASEVRQLYLTGINQQKPGIYFTKNNATDNEEVLFAATSRKNLNTTTPTNFQLFSNHTNFFGWNWTFNSTQNQNLMFALGTMGRMNTTFFNPTNNVSEFSSETMESISNSTLTWYDLFDGSLVGWWKFNEMGGTTVYDSAGNNNTATLTNGPIWITNSSCKNNFGGCVNFDGSNDYVEVNNTLTLNMTQDFTIEAWFKTSVTTAGTLVSKNIDNNAGYQLLITSGGHVSWLLQGGDNSNYHQIDSSANYADGNWHHAVGVARRTQSGYGIGSMELYVDGIERTSTDTILGSITNINCNQTCKFRVGSTSGGSTFFKGMIDNVRVYSRALSENDIKANYMMAKDDYPNFGIINQTNGATSNTVTSFNYDGGAAGIWRFDEGYGLNATDSSGNGNTGTLLNDGVSTLSTWMSNSSCKFGSCLYFHRASSHNGDQVEILDNPSIDFGSSTDFSLEAWISVNGTPSDDYTIINKGRASAGFGSFRLTVNNNGKLHLDVTDASTSVSINGVTSIDNTGIHHVAATVDRNGLAILYVNGMYENSASVASIGNIDNSDNLQIGMGKDSGGSTQTHFQGMIDEVSVYKRVLSDTEVREHYQREVTRYYDDFGTSASGKTYRYFGVEDSNTTLQPITPKDTIVHYRFNDNSTLNVTDSSGLGKSSIVINGVSWVTNSSCVNGFGGCMSFDGMNDYVVVPSGTFPSGSGPRTYGFWFKPRTLSGEQMFFFSGAQVADQRFIMRMSENGQPAGSLSVDGFNRYVRTGAPVVTVNEWNHLLVTHDGGNIQNSNTKIYVNGRQLVTLETGTGTTSTVSGVGYIGSYTGTDQFVKGLMDEFIVVNRSLSPDEVYQLYLGGSQRHGGDLVGWWKFNGNTTLGPALDSSGSGNTGNATNQPTWMNNASCKIGGCLSFDGSNDRIVVENERNFDFSKNNPFSVSFWMNQSSQSGDDAIIGKGTSVSVGRGYYIYTDSLGRLTARLLSNNTGSDELRYRITGDVTDNLRHHITFTYDGSNTWDGGKLYVDGTSETLNNDVGTTSITGDILNDYNLTLGSPTDGGGENWGGVLDDVKIWKRALTSDEVMNEYLQNQDQYSIYGSIHRVASADGVQSLSFNLTDHDGPYQNDYDQRSLLFGASQLDSTAPTITVQSPTNTTYITSSVWANVTVNETVSGVYRSLDSGTNVSMTNVTGNWNSNVSGISNGGHTLIFYATDDSGNTGYASMNFTVDTTVYINDVSINRTFNPLVPWWVEYVNISGYATYVNGTPFSSGSIRMNETNLGRETTLCSVSPSTSGSFYCNFSSKYQVGDTPVGIYAILAGSIMGNVTDVMETKPNYGEKPAGLTPRSVLETPFPIQEPSSVIRTIVTRLTISRGVLGN